MLCSPLWADKCYSRRNLDTVIFAIRRRGSLVAYWSIQMKQAMHTLVPLRRGGVCSQQNCSCCQPAHRMKNLEAKSPFYDVAYVPLSHLSARSRPLRVFVVSFIKINKLESKQPSRCRC